MKSLRLILLVLLSIFGNFLQAQLQEQPRIDSLLAELPLVIEDTNKVNVLVDLSFTYCSINPDQGINYGNQALKLSHKLNWKKGIANSNSKIGNNYYMKSDYSSALEYYFKALEIFEELQDRMGEAKVLGNIGNIFNTQSNYPKALEYFLKASKIFESLGDEFGIAISLSNIGNVYNYQSDYTKSLEYYFKAIKIYEKFNNKSALANNYGNIGTAYKSLSKNSQSLEFYFKALIINQELGNKSKIALNLGNIGLVYSDQSNYPKALEYFLNALNIYKELGDKNGIAIDLGNIGSTYLSIAKDDNNVYLNKLFNGNRKVCLQQAKGYTEQAIFISKEISDLNSLSQWYQQLSEIQTLLSDNKGALESYHNYTLYKDSVFNFEKNKKLTETAMQYEFDKKETATKAAQEKKDIEQGNILNFLVGGLLVAIIFLVIVNRQRKKVKQEKKRSDELLLNILPPEVAEELKQTGKAQAKQFDNVTVLFTDFVNFTGISEQMNPTELVAEIHRSFSAFDAIIEKHELEKIKTIGDAYMAVSGLPHETSEHAQKVVKAALEIRDYITKESGKFKVRIGINSGPVVAGIVGVKKYAYDIWGDTVNTANRMESNGAVGKVNISKTTYLLVKNDFNCEYRGKIEVKGKGEVEMYFIEREE